MFVVQTCQSKLLHGFLTGLRFDDCDGINTIYCIPTQQTVPQLRSAVAYTFYTREDPQEETESLASCLNVGAFCYGDTL